MIRHRGCLSLAGVDKLLLQNLPSNIHTGGAAVRVQLVRFVFAALLAQSCCCTSVPSIFATMGVAELMQ